MDDDYNFIIFEFNMNYTIDSIRRGYIEARKKERERISDEVLKKLGYTDADILMRTE